MRKSKSLLINFPGYVNELFNLMPDNGLANLAGSLKKYGHETKIIDFATISGIQKLYPYPYHQDLTRLRQETGFHIKKNGKIPISLRNEYLAILKEVDEYQAQRLKEQAKEVAQLCKSTPIDFIGFKLWSGSGLRGSIIIAETLKKLCPNIPIVGGGPHVDYFKEDTFKVTNAFDIYAYGEGEQIIVQLANYFTNGIPRKEDIPNLIFKKNNEIIFTQKQAMQDLTDIALPCYDENVYPAMAGNEKIHVFMIDESRGCPNSCNFCIHPSKSGRRRLLPAQVFVNRMEYLIEKYGAHGFRFAGSNPPSKLRNEIADEIIKRDLRIRYTAFAHARDASRQDFSLLRDSGCLALAYGIESGSQTILDQSINKKCKVEIMKNAIIECSRSGIYPIISLIVPSPGETEETMEETYQFCIESQPYIINVFPPFILPNTTWDKENKRFGIKYTSREEYFSSIMTTGSAFYPPQLWSSADKITINGRTFEESGTICSKFKNRLRKANFIVDGLDQLVLISSYSNFSFKTLKEKCHKWIFSGDYEHLYLFAEMINKAIKEASMENSQKPCVPISIS